ncbi:MAG: hypothetical protein LJE62_11650 [Silicimonas sp.]|nr:hypothetical protein [Silicimonas sp.]
MKTLKLDSFFADLQSAMVDGDMELLASHFVFPMVIYTVAGVSVLREDSDLLKVVREYRQSLKALGVAQSKLCVQQSDILVNHRRRATVRITEMNAEGGAITGSLIRYFLVESDGRYRIEMMEILEAALPTPEVERILH